MHLHQELSLQRQDLCRQLVSRRLGYGVSRILQEGVLLLQSPISCPCTKDQALEGVGQC